ncbi:MAG TPA: hypothetical protein VF110_09765 [Burkholderiales bacterium]
MKQLRFFVLMGVALAGAAAQAQPVASRAEMAGRAGKWDVSLVVPYAASKTFSFDGGASADVQSDYGLGVALNYGLNDQVSLGLELGWRDQDYTATAVPAGNNAGLPATFNGRLSSRWLKLTGAYHFLRESWHTPYLSGAIGAMHVDSGIPGGPPITGCYNYAWYGTSCETGVPTYNETNLNISLGLGYRMDFGGLVARVSVDQQWLNGGYYSGSQTWTEYRLQVGFKY